MNALRDVARQAIVIQPATPVEADETPLLAEVAQQLGEVTQVITNDAEFAKAAEDVRVVARIVKRVTEWFKEPIDNAHRQHKLLCDRRAEALKRPQAEEARLKRAIGDYSAAQERERLRQEREAQAAAAKAEEERVAREAAALESAGDKQLAAEVLEQHIATPAPVVRIESTTPKVAGVSTVEAWSFEIVNAALIPKEFLMPDEKKIRAYVNAMKSAARIPGVAVRRQDQVRVRA